MRRRSFLRLGGIAAASTVAAPAWQQEQSKLKITGVRIVQTRPRRPAPSFTPAPGSWSTNKVEVANPMSIYPEYKATRSLFQPDPGSKIEGGVVEISTDKGIKGYGRCYVGAAVVIEQHFTKLLMNEDPVNIERLWDILWRSSMYYGRKGIAVHAISSVDMALWDIAGKALNLPVYRLLGGATKPRLPAYCTGNDIEQHVEFGFKKLKLAIPHGPADGREGMRTNVQLVERARKALGPDGEIMLDCWMAWTERYTLEMAEMMAPHRVYWMEEVLQPHDYEGFGRLNEQIKSTRIATGEHEYTRYGFRQLLEHRSAEIWQPDINWCGGMSEARRIGALAAAYDIPVIPHSGGTPDCIHFGLATTNSPWAELFMPAPGGPKEVYQMWEEDNMITRGPEGIYARPSDRPGLGWDFVVS
jgi:L-rhamnonate dehydratase